MSERNIALVRPEIACLLKTIDRQSAKQLMKNLGIYEAKMVIIPVNDAEQLETWSSGNHWTVLVWNRENNIHCGSSLRKVRKLRQSGFRRPLCPVYKGP